MVPASIYALACDAHACAYSSIRGVIACVICNRNPMMVIQGCYDIANAHTCGPDRKNTKMLLSPLNLPIKKKKKNSVQN